MTFVLGAKSLSHVSHVDPRMIAWAKAAIAISAQDFGFDVEQSRTLAQEEVEVKEGFSHTLHSHHIIDCERPGLWAAPGYSGAVDAVGWNGTKFVWEWPRQYVIASAFYMASKATGILGTWGGYWNGLITDIPGDGSPAAMKAAQQGPHGGFDGPHMEVGRN